MIICSNCGSKKVVKDLKTSEISCAKCGLVLEEAVDTTLEHISDSQDSGRGAGGKVTYREPDMGVGTKIDSKDVRKLKKGKKRIFKKYDAKGNWKG